MQLGNLKNILNIGPEQYSAIHGYANKELIVLHETVSPDYPGWKDVRQISQYLDNKDYGIHGIVDLEGHVAYAYRYGKAVFYHTASAGTKGSGYVNTRSIGIELVSNVMLTEKDNYKRWQVWWERNKQIESTAQLIAWLAVVHKIPLIISDGSLPGITTHWQVTHKYGVSGGHVDCWPRHLGGYFPLRRIVARAKEINVW